MKSSTAILGAVLVLAHPGFGKSPRIEDRIRGRPIAALFPPLEHPAVRPVASATHMRDEDLVFRVSVAGQERAYPWWGAKNYHVGDAVVGGGPVIGEAGWCGRRRPGGKATGPGTSRGSGGSWGRWGPRSRPGTRACPRTSSCTGSRATAMKRTTRTRQGRVWTAWGPGRPI